MNNGTVRTNRGIEQCAIIMRKGAKIEVHGILVVTGALVMEEDTSLVVKAGSRLEIREMLHITNRSTFSVEHMYCVSYLDVKIHTATSIKPDHRIHFPSTVYTPAQSWIKFDESILVGLIRFFCFRFGMSADMFRLVVAPFLSPLYGILVAPKPYKAQRLC